ncbi:MAG: sigma-70 family RNA polymerase sigma factor [Pirellulaceae bacterium]
MQNPKTRLSLLANLKNSRADEAWMEFVELYRPLVIRVAQAKGLQHADAEDLAQDVLTTVGRTIETFEHRGVGSFRSWLYQVTRNLVVNRLTRPSGPIGSGDSKIQEWLSQHPSEDDPTASLFLLEYRRTRFQQAAAKIKGRFAADTWDAFWLTAVEQQSVQDVAEKLGKSAGAIRVARCRVIAKLREEVAGDDDSDILLRQ